MDAKSYKDVENVKSYRFQISCEFKIRLIFEIDGCCKSTLVSYK